MRGMDAPDRPLLASHDALRVFAEWGRRLRPRLTAVAMDRALPRHQHAAAAYLLRFPNLCDTIRVLGESGLFEESATLLRVITELAITAAWVGKNDDRAWDLVRDQEFHAGIADRRREEWLGIKSTRERLVEPKKLPNLWDRAVAARDDDLKRLYAAIYEWSSAPTHHGLTVLAHLEAESVESYGRGMAALSVQAALHLAVYASKNLDLQDGLDELRAAFSRWKASRT
jgi:hypothetical protein